MKLAKALHAALRIVHVVNDWLMADKVARGAGVDAQTLLLLTNAGSTQDCANFVFQILPRQAQSTDVRLLSS